MKKLTQQRPFQSPSLTPLHLHTLTMRNTFFIVYYRRPPSKNNIFSLRGRSWQISLRFKHRRHLGSLRDGDTFHTALCNFLTTQFILGHNMACSISKESASLWHLCPASIFWLIMGWFWAGARGCNSLQFCEKWSHKVLTRKNKLHPSDRCFAALFSLFITLYN